MRADSSTELSSRPERLHALDNLRAIMMWLGIVLHAGGIYVMKLESPLPWRDTRQSELADLIVAAIHAFRMPVFFIIAGFFCALLMASRGPDGMLKNRVRRLGLPFIVFWPLIWMASVIAALAFLHLMARGTWGLDASLVPASAPQGPNTIHLWFLWMLLWMCVAASLLARLDRTWFDRPAAFLLRLGLSPWGVVLLALPMMLADMTYPKGILHVSGHFIQPWQEWVHHVPYFAFGLVMHAHRNELFACYRRRRAAYAWAGVAAFIGTGVAHRFGGPTWVFPLFYAIAGWCWSFALIGWALDRMPMQRPWLAYLADSSYWVYLLHMPLTIAFGAVLFAMEMPAELKMLLNIAATTAVCLASYQLFVRRTFVSVLLNGRRHASAAALQVKSPAEAGL